MKIAAVFSLHRGAYAPCVRRSARRSAYRVLRPPLTERGAPFVACHVPIVSRFLSRPRPVAAGTYISIYVQGQYRFRSVK